MDKKQQQKPNQNPAQKQPGQQQKPTQGGNNNPKNPNQKKGF